MSSAYINIGLLFGSIGLLIILIISMGRLNKRQNLLRQNEVLRQQVVSHRLYKMLSYLGVNFDQYISALPISTILRHVANCRKCPNVIVCDKCLYHGKVMSDMNFCPNYQSLLANSRRLVNVE